MKKATYQKIVADRIYKINKLTQIPYNTLQLLKEVGGDSRLYTVLIELKATSYEKSGFTVWNKSIPVSQALLDSVLKRYYEKIQESAVKKAQTKALDKGIRIKNPIVPPPLPGKTRKSRTVYGIDLTERKEFNLFWGLIKFRW